MEHREGTHDSSEKVWEDMIEQKSICQSGTSWLRDHESELIYCKTLKLKMLRKNCELFKSKTRMRFSDIGMRHQYSHYCAVCPRELQP
jgi:hypothetical protein